MKCNKPSHICANRHDLSTSFAAKCKPFPARCQAGKLPRILRRSRWNHFYNVTGTHIVIFRPDLDNPKMAPGNNIPGNAIPFDNTRSPKPNGRPEANNNMQLNDSGISAGLPLAKRGILTVTLPLTDNTKTENPYELDRPRTHTELFHPQRCICAWRAPVSPNMLWEKTTCHGYVCHWAWEMSRSFGQATEWLALHDRIAPVAEAGQMYE